MWAIRNKRTRKWLYGTDYRYRPFHQRTSRDRVLVFGNNLEANIEFKHRQCGKDYEIVLVRIEAID